MIIPIPFAPSKSHTHATLLINGREVALTLPRRSASAQTRRPVVFADSGIKLVGTPKPSLTRLAPVNFQVTAEPSDKTYLLQLKRSYVTPTGIAQELNNNLHLLKKDGLAFSYLRYQIERWEGMVWEVKPEPITLRVSNVRSRAPDLHLADGRRVYTVKDGLSLKDLGFVAIKLDRGFVEPDYGKRSTSTVYLNSLKEGQTISAVGLRPVRSTSLRGELTPTW